MAKFVFDFSVTRQFTDEDEEVIALFKSDNDAWAFIQGLRTLDEQNDLVTLTGDEAFEKEGIAVSSEIEDGGGFVTVFGPNEGTVTYRLRQY